MLLRNSWFKGSVYFSILAFSVLGVGFILAQSRTQGKGTCNNNDICESGEYNYSASHENQACLDCRAKLYFPLVIDRSRPQIVGANSTIGKVFQFKWTDTNADGIPDAYRDTWAGLQIADAKILPEMGDIDGDGIKEILALAEYSTKVGTGKKAATYYDYKFFFYRQNNATGHPDFESPARFGYSGKKIYLGGFVAGDVDNDGIDEVILNKVWQVEIYKFNGYDFELKWIYEADYNAEIPLKWAYGVSVGNADNDPLGKNELVLATVDDGQAYIYSYIGTDFQGKFVFGPPVKTESMGYCYIDLAKVRDVDNDGLNEIVGCGNNGCLMVWKYENGVYRKKFISPVSLGTYTEEIDAGDLDGGSSFPDNEVVIWGTGANKIYVMKYDDPNPGDDIYGTFQILTQLTLKSGIRELCVGDVDGEGKAELVLGGATDGLYIYDLINGSLEQVYQSVYGSPWGPRIK
jgi:hypothetical protein